MPPVTLILFWTFAGLAITAATLCIIQKSPMASALWLIVTLFALAALFVLLDAQFLGVLQVLVYAGAIMVLFLFVIMLLNLGRPGVSDLKGPVAAVGAALLAGVLLLQLGAGAGGPPDLIRLPKGTMAAMQREGIVTAIARPLFTDYLIPFEITSILLLAAIVGAVVLAKRKL